jgi:hypothetical protein
MVLIAVGFALMTRITVHSTYLDALPAFLLMGGGTGLAFAPCTESVMGSLPLHETGVGAATNSAALQIGGALGVGVLGSLLNARYQDALAPLVTHQAMPDTVRSLITGSLGGALAVAQHVGGALGGALATVARHAFVSGMDLAVTVGAVVVSVAALVTLALLPNRGQPVLTPEAGADGTPAVSRHPAPPGVGATAR